MFEPLGQLIKRNIAKSKFSNELIVVSIFNAANKVVEKEFGQNLVKPLSFKDGVLSLKVSNPILSQEIQSRNQEFLDNINEELGGKRVLKILFR
jgi:hypothetical protein